MKTYKISKHDILKSTSPIFVKQVSICSEYDREQLYQISSKSEIYSSWTVPLAMELPSRVSLRFWTHHNQKIFARIFFVINLFQKRSLERK